MNRKTLSEDSKLRVIRAGKPSKLKMSERVRQITKDIKGLARFVKLIVATKSLDRAGGYDQFAALDEFKRQFLESGGSIADDQQNVIGVDCECLLLSSYKDLNPPIVIETKYAIGEYSLFYRISKDIYSYLSNGRINGAIFIVHDSTGEVDFNNLRDNINRRFGSMFGVLIMSSEEVMGVKINSRANRVLFSLLEENGMRDKTWLTKDFDELYADARLEVAAKEVGTYNMTVFFGAGLSSSAGFPTWNNLIESSWWETARGRDKLENANDQYVLDKINDIIGDTPLLKARMLQESQGDVLFWRLRDLLYPQNYRSSDLLDESCNLIKYLLESNKLGQVLTLNYDNLVEEGLDSLGIHMPPLYGNDNIYNDNKYVFHVHGYLPPPPQRLTPKETQSIIFSESTYNLLASNSYAATNIRILQRLVDDSCIFIGHSMTDPNIRRLLEVSQDIRRGRRHLWFKRLPDIDRNDMDKYIFNRQISNLQERIMNSLGVNVIWYKDHNDLPQMVRKLIDILSIDHSPTPAIPSRPAPHPRRP